MTLTIRTGRALARPFGSSALELPTKGREYHGDGFGANATVTNLFVVTLRAVSRLTAPHSPRFAIRNSPRIDGECESF
jgi:hypothetical protein